MCLLFKVSERILLRSLIAIDYLYLVYPQVFLILNRNDLFLVVSCDSSPLIDCLEERGGLRNELFVVVMEKH